MTVRNSIMALAVFALVPPRMLSAIELQPETIAVWNDYTRQADSAMQARLDGQHPFLWIEEAPDRSRRLRGGEILVAPANGHGTRSVENGLIHHWIGAMFIPNATVANLFAVVHDYGRYKEFYKPVVADSKVLAGTGTEQRFEMIWQHRTLFVNTAIEGLYEARDFAVDGRRGYRIADTARVQEIEAYGQPGEHRLRPGEGNGFLWRVHSIARYAERDGGVYLELEALALTRDVPASLRWLVNPVVKHLSMQSLATSLRQTRAAVEALPGKADTTASSVTAKGSGSRKASADD